LCWEAAHLASSDDSSRLLQNWQGRRAGSAAKQFAEKLVLSASGAEAREEAKDSIAALKTLRHPKSLFFNKL